MASLFISCTPQRKLSRLIKKHPELVRDSTYIDFDTTIVDIPAVRSDSIFTISSTRRDTFIIEKERLRVRTIVHKDTLIVEGECMGIKDTIVSREEHHHPVIVNKQQGLRTEWVIILMMATLLATVIINNILTKRNERKEK